MQSIEDLLLTLNIINKDSIIEFFPGTRDNPDLKVYKCLSSGVIFIKENQLNTDHYQTTSFKDYLSYMGVNSYHEVLKNTHADDARRLGFILNLILNKKWCDIGAGFGGVLKLGKRHADLALAVEPQPDAKKILEENGLKVFRTINEIPNNYKIDIASLFNVLEHMFDPIDELRKIFDKLTAGGKIIVEVPHASDFLIKQLDLLSFKKFTFWSEHLILHTRKSLERFLVEAGFRNIIIKGIQRYPLSNHLYWLKNGLPGGHLKWSPLNTEELNTAYENMLNSIDMTDTLLATAEK